MEFLFLLSSLISTIIIPKATIPCYPLGQEMIKTVDGNITLQRKVWLLNHLCCLCYWDWHCKAHFWLLGGKGWCLYCLLVIVAHQMLICLILLHQMASVKPFNHLQYRIMDLLWAGRFLKKKTEALLCSTLVLQMRSWKTSFSLSLCLRCFINAVWLEFKSLNLLKLLLAIK